jgi:hypothetical protein
MDPTSARRHAVDVRRTVDPGSAEVLLQRARAAMRSAVAAAPPDDRFAGAHLAALRGAAAVVAARGRPLGLRRRLVSVWLVLERVAPELAGDAAYFAAGAKLRAAIEAGAYAVVTQRQADDQVRAAEDFLQRVEELILSSAAMLAS